MLLIQIKFSMSLFEYFNWKKTFIQPLYKQLMNLQNNMYVVVFSRVRELYSCNLYTLYSGLAFNRINQNRREHHARTGKYSKREQITG